MKDPAMPACDLLFIFSHTPYGSSTAKEGLEAALAAGAFDQDVSILFIGDGVWQLTQSQDTSASNRKNHQKMAQALPVFGIEHIYVDQDSLTERGLALSELALNGAATSSSDTIALMKNAKHILSF